MPASTPRNPELARLFQQMADMNQLLDGNRFKTIAFQRAADVLAELSEEALTLSDGRLLTLDGIGKGVVEKIREFGRTGTIDEHTQLSAQVPAGLLEVLGVPGLGPKTVALMWREAGVDGLPALQKALDTGTLEKLKGFGAKKIENLRKSLAFAAQGETRRRLGKAWPLAEWLLDQLQQRLEIPEGQFGFAGSLRRGRETIGDIDLLAAVPEDRAAEVLKVFTSLDVVAEVLAHGETKASIRSTPEAGGLQVDLRVVPPAAWGAALLYFTGSKEHNVRLRERAIARGLRLNEYGLERADGSVIASDTEEAIYDALDLAWIPPELREDRGEIALAEKRQLPALLHTRDLQAELHTHTTASDGRWSIRQLVEAALARGFHTLAITDHSKGQVQANGLGIDRLLGHIAAIRTVAREFAGRITVLAGSEVDILKDGTLDYPDEILAQLDVVVASPHGALTQPPEEATARFLRAIENPYVTIMGHLTGRLILRREGLSPDLKALFKAGAERGIAFEINANHYRLDLRDTHARLALEHGCKLSINTDAHGPGDLDELRYGVATARRAGATAQDVINCLSAQDLAAWLQQTRR